MKINKIKNLKISMPDQSHKESNEDGKSADDLKQKEVINDVIDISNENLT